jgi:hypothetical protein
MMEHPIYRVKNWDELFENNRTREMKNMTWVPVPNRHDGEGFQRIMREPDGISVYGCWQLILQVSSRCLRERGTLLRDDGAPLTAESFALKTGWRRVEDFERALALLSTPEIGWLEVLTKEGAVIPQEGAVIPHDPARKGREGKGIEEKGSSPARGRAAPPFVTPSEIGDLPGWQEAWDAWVTFRKSKRAPVTERVKRTVQQRLARRPAEAIAALDTCMAAGWTDVQWEWIDRRAGIPAQVNGSVEKKDRPRVLRPGILAEAEKWKA